VKREGSRERRRRKEEKWKSREKRGRWEMVRRGETVREEERGDSG
jgi:hypothetical protein